MENIGATLYDESGKQRTVSGNISISSYIRCCAGEGAPLVTAGQGVVLMSIVEALYRSAAEGKVVEI